MLRRPKHSNNEVVAPKEEGYAYVLTSNITALTFKNRASYIQDGRTATLQMLHFIYFFNKYKY